MKQQIRKPENWQDFEELCKILWEEIWDCQEIKKNGRLGQNQNGIDICGIPKGENNYFGIQCKGKDEYTNSNLTQREILLEIEKAKTFKPSLKKLYFATTANKDSGTEEFIRLLNADHIEKGLFEVHLFSWEDIAYLIDRNKKTSDWYLKKNNYISNFKIEVLFDNEATLKEFKPILLKNSIKYKYREEIITPRNLNYYRTAEELRSSRIAIDTEAQPIRYFIDGTIHNKSSCVFSVHLRNIGKSQLENYKLYLSITDECYVSEIVSKRSSFVDLNSYAFNIKWVPHTSDLEFNPHNNILVQNDEVVSDKICIRPTIEEPFCIVIPWKFVAKDYTEYGQLKIIFNTKIKEKSSEVTYSSHFPDEIILENYTGE